MVKITLYMHGPRARIEVGQQSVEIGPDVFIAVEGLGTFKGVSLEDRLREIIKSGKDLYKHSLKVHKESTRRGHASITTSMVMQMEITECSRVLSMLLTAHPFGSYLQESQRRSIIDENYVVIPRNLDGYEQKYRKTFLLLLSLYRSLINDGVEIEDARYIMPIGVKTSLYSSVSLETCISLLQIPRDAKHSEYCPWEVYEFGDKLKAVISDIAPALLEARLAFRNRLATYSYPNPFKQSDPIVNEIVSKMNRPDEPMIISTAFIPENGIKYAEKLMEDEEKEIIDSINPLFHVISLEPMSLVAYHQAIRHRTIPTAVESIYTAVERALAKPEENIIIPPSIKAKNNMSRKFQEHFTEALALYEEMIHDGIPCSSACYIIPQAMRIYVIRHYNGYNLLFPQGFIGTRTCAYTQWEERGIAYKIWYEVAKKSPSLADIMGEKCKHLGFCPEKKWCPIILKYHKYDDEIHKSHNNT